MTRISVPRAVIVGVDTHKDVHVAVAVDQDGRLVGRQQVKTTQQGCAALHNWAVQLAPCVRFAVEGTGSYGAGLSRYLAQRGIQVTEVRGPSRQLRHDRGKSDTVDAEAAARSALAGTATTVPKSGNDWVEQLRVLRVARRSAIQARTQTINQMHAVVVGAPHDLHDQLQRLSRHQLVAHAAHFRVTRLDDARSVARWTLRLLAQRRLALSAEIAAIDSIVAPLISSHAGSLLGL